MNIAIFCCCAFIYLIGASAFGRYIFEKLLNNDDLLAIMMGLFWPLTLPIYTGVMLGFSVGKAASKEDND